MAPVFLALLLAACGGTGATEGPASAADGDGRAATAGDSGAGTEPEMAGEANEPGITDEVIRIGGSYPVTGPLAAVIRVKEGAEAYFSYLNDEFGGVTMGDGVTRRIEFINYDDGYQPARTLENVRRLVEDDEVFALFGTFGTPGNVTIAEYLKEVEVPNIFVGSGASLWGDKDEYPWTVGWHATYTTEAAIYVEYLKDERPGASLSLLVQNDEFGRDYQRGIEAALEGSDLTLAGVETYETSDPSVGLQIEKLRRAGADIHFSITTPTAATQAISLVGASGWDPLHLLASVSATIAGVIEPAGAENAEGLVTAHFWKEPADPRWEDDPDMQLMREVTERYFSDATWRDSTSMWGYASAETFVKVLEDMSEPTRAELMRVVGNMDYEQGTLLPGVKVVTSADDPYPIETMVLDQFIDGRFQQLSDAISYEGRTPQP